MTETSEFIQQELNHKREIERLEYLISLQKELIEFLKDKIERIE